MAKQKRLLQPATIRSRRRVLQRRQGALIAEYARQVAAMIDERVKVRVATLRVVPCGCLHKVVGSRLERRGPSSIAGCTDCGGSGYVLRAKGK